jgi:hypothetical protein
MREKAEQGYYPSHAMVGYKTIRIKKRSYLVIDETKAPFIKEIFNLYATGNYSYLTLAAEMRRRGFQISQCVKCGKSHIEKILKNPVYMGDFMWKGKRYFNGKHQPIISAELYYICQKIIIMSSIFIALIWVISFPALFGSFNMTDFSNQLIFMINN